MELSTFFDRCCLINLDRRTDRWESAQAKLQAIHWPFKPIERVRAIDGSRVPKPRWYRQSDGGWGCSRTHQRILEDAQMDGLNSVLVLEDDFYFADPSTFTAEVTKFVNAVPDDWELLMLGGQHMGSDGGEVSPGVVKCNNTQRTHAYAVRGKAISELYQIWSNTPDHIDWAFKTYMPYHRVYAPSPFLIGQDEGKSDINGADNSKKLWRAPKSNPPVYLFLNTERETIETLRAKGFHFGRRRNERGEDVGLEPIWRDRNARTRPTKLRQWVDMIQWEAASEPNTGTAIWHSATDLNLVREVCGKTLVVLDHPTVDQAVSALNEHGGSAG